MASDTIATALQAEDHELGKVERLRQRTLGNVRLRHHETNEIILVPTPSSDPNDPLNWPQWYKKCIAVLICLAMLWCNFLAAGPTVAIVETTLSFFPDATPTSDPAQFNKNISKVSYFFTTTALLQGLGNFFWVPFANKYGRRPAYVFSYTLYLGCAIWAIFDRSFGGFLAARILMGLGAGAAETIAPVTISDVFFLHERGAIMALYTSFLSVGVAFGIVISGLITINHSWGVIYEVAAAFIGLMLVLAFFAFPETAYRREERLIEEAQAREQQHHTTAAAEAAATETHSQHAHDPTASSSEKTPTEENAFDTDVEQPSTRVVSPSSLPHHRTPYLQRLRLFSGTYTSEPLYKIFLRPLGLICLPPVLWSALVQSVTVGFVVAVTSNVDTAFEATYGFASWQVGLCFISAVIGSIIGVPAGGILGDRVADYFTRRNGGIREPEMRLPAMIPSLLSTPLALVLYGVGVQKKLHWICPTIGLGLLNFSIVQGTNICLVYVIDAYRPVAGEITLAVMGFKSLFGFLLSFYTNPWVDEAGYADAYGAMAGIAAAIIILWVPLYIWGRGIRHVTWKWPIISSIHWDDDREVGE